MKNKNRKSHSKTKQSNGTPHRQESKSYLGSISVSGKGVGYVEIPDSKVDIEIQQSRLHGAYHNDEVEIRLTKNDDKRLEHPTKSGARSMKDLRPQGEVVKILSRAKKQLVGTLEKEKGKLFLIPDDHRMYQDVIITHGGKNFEPHTKALVKITKWQEDKSPEGEIIKILGMRGEHNVEMESIIFEKGFDTTFPEAVEKEADEIEKKEKPIPEAEIRKRRDFRDTLTFTIDPENAKDFDDAISFKKIKDGLFEIGVHIADVSHYVREGSALDREAAKRAFSVYLVDRTIPMLPEILSNDICSLNPNEDKLTFSAVFEMTSGGKIAKEWFGKSIIKSDKRFSYEGAQEVLDQKSGEYFYELNTLNSIAKILAKEKYSAGAIDFEKDEVRFDLDPKGKPLGVYRKERLETHKLVEDFMLLANRKVAEFIFRENSSKKHKEGAFIYRIHDFPDQEKLADLSLFIKALGYDLESHDGKITSKSLKKLLADVQGKSHESLVKTAAIRSMAKAIYSTRNIGHFGLAFKHYAHFTSPIRRYPDLLVHRVLHAYLEGKKIGDHEMAFYEKMAGNSSKREIMAAEAERASIKYKQVEYMKEHVGESFAGTISGVTEWGIYVEDEETKCEGMVKIRDLGDDFYNFDEKNYAIVGEKKKMRFTLGDKVKFTVVKADLERKTLDYKLV
ncbi:MAG: ribonuclease R [Candidatus Taylorbacteria bacterium]